MLKFEKPNYKVKEYIEDNHYGKFEIEPGNTLYGLTLSHALNRIAHHRTAKKWEEENTTLKEFLKEFHNQYNLLLRLCRESAPEKFDTGE